MATNGVLEREATNGALEREDESQPRWTVAGSEFPRKLADLLFQYMDSSSDRNAAPPSMNAAPEEILKAFEDSGIPLSLDGVSKTQEALLEACRLTMKYSMRTGHPLYLNFLYGHHDPVSTAAEWLAAACNCNLHTYEASPVFSLMEREVLARVAQTIGPDFFNEHDGLFVPGGSIGNMYGILLARHRICPDVRKRGNPSDKPLVLFTSDQAHYSYDKSTIVMGLGLDNLIKVKSDENGAMDPIALDAAVRAAIAEGKQPFFVGATAGTTVIGSFDPLMELSAVCKRHNLWLHVDGAWGGPLVFAPAYRHLLAGIEEIDSFAMDAHKMMGLPQQCNLFLTRHRGLMEKSHGTGAQYLFQADKKNANLDRGDKTIQCGRRNDSLKLWLAWQAVGDAGWAERISRSGALAQLACQRITTDSRFRMTVRLSFGNVCFWYLPADLRHFDPASATEEERTRLHAVCPRAKARLQQTGGPLVNYQPLKGLPNCWRLVFPAASVNTASDIDTILEAIAAASEA
eukprot:TRINITY_DN8800_c0_g1_i1.p1 TRINITY_DN8800_c0_g1~~TRINITY_DN8800_c0_g1_i1.p1  ORF type:complete len:516 (+),score=100.48 TRINITY_DN8800_c0_g1_i1:68-1615(+)